MTRKSGTHFSDLMPAAQGASLMRPDSSLVKTTDEQGAAPEISPRHTAAVSRKPKAQTTEVQATETQADDKPHHLGHRDRLRTRFVEGGGEALADYELIEMLLFLGIPRKDTKPLAKDLIKHFKSYEAVLATDYDDLAAFKGMTKNAAVALKLVQASAHRMLRASVMGEPVLNSWARLMDYLRATMAQEKKEHFRILFLDRKNNLIADEVQQSGTVDQTPVYPREIVKRAIQLNATALILVHNHPSGDPSPSRADIDMTKHVVDAAKTLDIVVHDHIIVSRKGLTSLKNEGLMG